MPLDPRGAIQRMKRRVRRICRFNPLRNACEIEFSQQPSNLLSQKRHYNH
jgi:hypothetical protein